MYEYISIFTSETLTLDVSTPVLLRDVFRFKHHSWKIKYVGNRVFVIYNEYNIFFQRLCITSSGNKFALDVAVQSDVGRVILQFIKKGGE